MKVYRVTTLKKCWRIAISVGLMLLAVWLLAGGTPKSHDSSVYLILAAVIFIGIGLWTIKTTLDFKVVIDDKTIRVTNNFKTTELEFSDVEGYVISTWNIFLTGMDKSKPEINIPSSTESYDEIKEWVKSTFNDLRALKAHQEETEILKNEKFGATVAFREQYLAQAKAVTKIFNAIGVVIAFWAYLMPEPLSLVWALCIFFPLSTIVVQRYYKGLVRLDATNDGGYPGIVAVFFVQITPLLIIPICWWLRSFWPPS